MAKMSQDNLVVAAVLASGKKLEQMAKLYFIWCQRVQENHESKSFHDRDLKVEIVMLLIYYFFIVSNNNEI